MGGPGAQVTDAGGRLEGWQPSGRLAGPCGRLVGPDGRPGAGKKDSLASGADRLVGLAGRQADRPCWQQAGRPGARLAGPAGRPGLPGANASKVSPGSLAGHRSGPA